MEPADAQRAVAAASSTVAALDLAVDEVVVLNDSNRLVLRLMPCDLVARVAIAPPEYRARLEREVEIAESLAAADSPIAGLDPRVGPRVVTRDGFTITMWTHFEAVARTVPPAEYAQALGRLHAGLRQVEVRGAHFMDRVAGARHDVASRDVTSDLADADRALLADTLRDLGESIVHRTAAEQLLHGEPHAGNLLATKVGPLFMDFENACRGPVEYDLAWVPRAVSERYPNADQGLLGDCRGLVLAMIAMHRWSTGDHHPSGRAGGVAFLDAVRDGPPWRSLEDVVW